MIDFRGAKYNETGGIDVQILNENLGWIPFTARKDDADKNGQELHAAIIAAGNIAPYVAPAPIKAPAPAPDPTAAALDLIANTLPAAQADALRAIIATMKGVSA